MNRPYRKEGPDAGRTASAVLLLVSFALSTACAAAPGDAGSLQYPHYRIQAAIDAPNSRVEGTVTISLPSAENLAVTRKGLKILSVLVGGRATAFDADEELLVLKAGPESPVEIRFEGTFRPPSPSKGTDHTVNVINDRGVALTRNWFPRAEGLFTHDLTVTLPKGYSAVSEAEESVSTARGDSVEFAFTFPRPSDSVIIIATNRYEVLHERHSDTDLVFCFFPEERELAKTYVGHAKKLLDSYERAVGPFPFRRFAVIQSFLPTGFSAPTMAVLGQEAVRLPFVAERSLARGLLRQWFGHMVYVEPDDGDWSEGLAAYLACRFSEDEKANGWACRKQMLIDFESCVNGAGDVPLDTPAESDDLASTAIVRGKGAMVFHMLRTLVGEERFSESLRDLVAEQRFRPTSWEDLRLYFERVSGNDLSWFFDQWVGEAGIPDLTLENVSIKWNGSAYETRFDLAQHEGAYRLSVPVVLFSSAGPVRHVIETDERKKSIEILTKDLPEKVVLDGGYDLFRRLSSDEFPPVLSRLFGAESLVIVPPLSDADRYDRLGRLFGNAAVVQPGAVALKDMESSSYLLLGDDNPVVRRIFGRLRAEAGFTLTVRRNPSYPGNVVAIASADSEDELERAAGGIIHYGAFSTISFVKGKNVLRETAPSARGIEKDLAGQITAVEPPPVKTLRHVIGAVRDKRIIYVGEAHDRFAHHAVQLEIVKALHRANRKVAIGMEMFQRPFQQALDDFIASRIDEREFLIRSEYFKRWGYDYNLYKPILDYARQENIPVVALNIRREITEKVSKSGIDGLTDEEKKDLPKEMDFSDQAYRDKLYEIFKSHPSSREGSFDLFVQNQLLWDETMAESLDDFLKCRPDHQMIVLAGNGHVAFGSGIPKRAFRRNGMSYATIANGGETDEATADHIVSTKQVDAVSAPKLMVILDEKGGRLTVTGFSEHSVSEKAGMKKGDVILSFDGREVSTVPELRFELYFKKKGDAVNVKVRRKEPEETETIKDLEVTL